MNEDKITVEVKLTKQELEALVKKIVLDTLVNERRVGGILHDASK